MKVTIVFAFRDREVSRVLRSLDSLKTQSNKNFDVLFVDYGSKPVLAIEISSVVSQYDFVQYSYLYTQYQPWNKSKALNYALNQTITDFFFVADIDMIFRADFIEIALQQSVNLHKNIYFKVGYLSKEESTSTKEFEKYVIQSESNHEATGLTLFYTSNLKNIGGFDNFFHFWGSEDTEVHVRLRNAGFDIYFYDEQILLLHQWHSSYMRSERKTLKTDLQLRDVIKLNFNHLNNAISTKKKVVNQVKSEINKNDFLELIDDKNIASVLNIKHDFTYFLFVVLPNFEKGILKVNFTKDPFSKTLKFYIKRLLRKKVPEYYSLKEINDQLLLHIVSFYHHFPYIYQVSNDLKSITFAIKK